MFPVHSVIQLNKDSSTPLYRQIANAIVKAISNNIILPGGKFPSSRHMSKALGINRRTYMKALIELEAQGWIDVIPHKGSFVKNELPIYQPVSYFKTQNTDNSTSIPSDTALKNDETLNIHTVLNDGYPDIDKRINKEIAKNYVFLVSNGSTNKSLNYTQSYRGDIFLRNEVLNYLSETRAIHRNIGDVLITRGSIMSIFSVIKSLLNPGEGVIVAHPGFSEGHESIKLAGGIIYEIGVDDQGIKVKQIENLCKKHTIKAVFVIPHHHFPTTATLSPERRVILMNLAIKYRFYIIEDDYDYEFHYKGSPILPISTYGPKELCIYIGSFSKSIAPSLRIGFIIADESLGHKIENTMKSIDSFGNTTMEKALAMMFKNGSLIRHLNRSREKYQQRRDCLITQLNDHAKVVFRKINKPDGGLAAWLELNASISAKSLQDFLCSKGWKLPSHQFYQHQSTMFLRIGFATLSEKEIEKFATDLSEFQPN